jgi:hypothetical protein
MFRRLLLAFLLLTPLYCHAQPSGLMVVGFNLDDRTGIPDAPEELDRIALLTQSMLEALALEGIALVEPNEEIRRVNQSNSPTYLFDHPELAASLARTGPDYLLVAVAFKPTYLFVYPRTLLIETATGKVIQARAFQLESSWSDANTTANTGRRIAKAVADELKSRVPAGR